MTELLLYLVLGLQFIGLILITVVWRRQNSGHIAALKETCDGLAKGQERLETLVRDEMAGNRHEAGEQARISRDEAGASALKLTDQLGTLQRDNLAFREHLSERLSTNMGALAKNLSGQIENSGAAHQGESSQIRVELLAAFEEMDVALAAYLKAATSLQDQRFEQFERLLIALGERNADQIHSMDDAISESLEVLQREANENWSAKRDEENAANQEARRELHEALERLSDAVAKNFSVAGEAQRGQFDSFEARVAALIEARSNPHARRTVARRRG